MVAPLCPAVGCDRICRDTFHDSQCEIEQLAGPQDVAHRISDPPSLIPCLGEQAVHDFGKKAIWPVGVNAIAGSIKFLHITPHRAAIFHHRHLVTRDSFTWNVDDMFHIVEEGDGIVIGA